MNKTATLATLRPDLEAILEDFEVESISKGRRYPLIIRCRATVRGVEFVAEQEVVKSESVFFDDEMIASRHCFMKLLEAIFDHKEPK